MFSCMSKQRSQAHIYNFAVESTKSVIVWLSSKNDGSLHGAKASYAVARRGEHASELKGLA